MTKESKKHGVNKGHRWKKGESGNLKGRPPKGYSITEMMKEMLKANPDIKRDISKTIAAKAKQGDMNAIKLLWSYMDGYPIQGLEHKGADGEPITITAFIKKLNEEEEQKDK